jgi:hypothetical protein
MRTRAKQMAAIRADQQLWRDLAAEVRPGRYSEPGPMGDWSFADLAGHLLGWRDRTIARLGAAARGEPEPAPPWPPSLDDDDSFQVGGADPDAINAWIRDQHAGRAPEQLVADYDASYDRLIAAIESLPDQVLTDADAFPWIGAPAVTVDFTGHLHEEHLPGLRAWLDS